MRVLITGAGGYIGRHLIAELQSEHELLLADLHSTALRVDVTRLEEVLPALQGVDAVIHLAVASGHEGETEDDAFNAVRFDVNVKGTWNVLEAARRAGVRRVVHTSSIMVTWGYPPTGMIPGDAPARTVGTYSLTKHLAEQVCEHFARNQGLSIVCLRIAKPIDLNDPRWRDRPIRPQWIGFPDLIQAYRRALETPQIGFEIVTVVGESSRRRWDLEPARRVLGYEPTFQLEERGYSLGEEREPFTF